VSFEKAHCLTGAATFVAQTVSLCCEFKKERKGEIAQRGRQIGSC